MLARDDIFLMNFMMRMTQLDVVYEWKLIRKYQKWLYNLHMNPITTRQTESTLSSCIILNLKTLFKFVSQCSFVPYLESDLCNVGNELDNCDFAVV